MKSNYRSFVLKLNSRLYIYNKLLSPISPCAAEEDRETSIKGMQDGDEQAHARLTRDKNKISKKK